MLADFTLTPSARYGASIVGVLFGTYLTAETSFSDIAQATEYAGSVGSEPILSYAQFFLVVGVFIASFALAPASSARRVAAVTLSSSVLFLWLPWR